MGASSTTGQRFCMNGVVMSFTANEEDPNLVAEVQERSERQPYKLAIGQALPSVFFNLIIGGLFFNAFVVNMSSMQSSSGVGGVGIFEVLPLFPALYYGFTVARSVSRIFLK